MAARRSAFVIPTSNFPRTWVFRHSSFHIPLHLYGFCSGVLARFGAAARRKSRPGASQVGVRKRLCPSTSTENVKYFSHDSLSRRSFVIPASAFLRAWVFRHSSFRTPPPRLRFLAACFGVLRACGPPPPAQRRARGRFSNATYDNRNKTYEIRFCFRKKPPNRRCDWRGRPAPRIAEGAITVHVPASLIGRVSRMALT